MDEGILYLACFCLLGIGGFFWGFTRLQRKRLIENIPTSTIRGAAMGLVELTGKAEMDYPLKSPFQQAACVFFKYKIEKYVSSRKSGRWVTLAQGDSQNTPFYLEDGTGKVLVLPRNAELFLPCCYHYQTGWGKPIPALVEAFMSGHAIRYQTFLGRHTLRFREWYVRQGETVYVLGTARQTRNSGDDYRQALAVRLNEIKDDPGRMAEIDLDQDGEISDAEWQTAVDKMEREIIAEQVRQSSLKNEEGVVVTQGETEKMFIISNHSQKELVSRLFWESLAGIYGGALVTIGTGWYLVHYFAAYQIPAIEVTAILIVGCAGAIAAGMYYFSQK